MVTRQEAADKFAHDIINRMRGVVLTPAAAAQIKAHVDSRTRPDEGPVQDVMAVLRGKQLEEPEAQAILEFIGAITRPPFSMTLTADEAQRFGLTMPAAVDKPEHPQYRRLGDNPQA